MSRRRLVACLAALAMWCGIGAESVVVVDGTAAVVRRSDADGLDAVARTRLAFGPPRALAACNFWDVRELCCPAGCAARSGHRWAQADDILRGCMRALGCPEGETRSATVFMKCDCPR